jgi:hypothetical protein
MTILVNAWSALSPEDIRQACEMMEAINLS